MATDPSWVERSSARPWWNRSFGWIIIMLIALLVGVLFWVGWQALPERAKPQTASKRTSSASAPASAIMPPQEAVASAAPTQSKANEPAFPPGSTPNFGPGVAVSEDQKAAAKKAAAAKTASAPAKAASQGAVAKKPLLAAKAPGVTKPAAEKVETAKAATTQPFRWTHVGGDPCNPKVGCTAEWALEQSKWPTSVQSALIAKVKGESPEIYTMHAGWRGWMTWGSAERKFRSDTLAAWPSGQEERSSLWHTDYAGTRYNLVKVEECGNWGGFTSAVRPSPRPGSSNERPLGVIPVVTCL